jgi:hypothetical protein
MKCLKNPFNLLFSDIYEFSNLYSRMIMNSPCIAALASGNWMKFSIYTQVQLVELQLLIVPSLACLNSFMI